MFNRRQLIASGSGLLLAGSVASAHAQVLAPPDVSSTRFVSMNADTGALFAQQGAHDQVAIASLTKVFTAMEAMQLASLDTRITTTSDDYQPAEATVMGFGAGESFTLEELIYGMLLPSGNDAAHAIARSLGYQEGDTAEEAVNRFMDLVNQRVLAMGLTNTNLINPHGWGVPNHYSSAADVAAFMAYASENEFLVQVMGTQRYTTSTGYVLTNSNRALATAPSVIAGKTGYDWDSGWCLVQLAQRQSTRIIAVTLDGIAPDIWYNDNLVLLDYGFDRQTALGTDPFEGDIMAWSDPAPLLFAQAGTGEVAIAGETKEKEIVVTREETIPQQPIVIAAPEPEVEPIAFDGHASSARWSGITGAILAGTMAVSRWIDFGGDHTQETISPSVRAAGSSIKGILPTLPTLNFSRSSEEIDEEGNDDEEFDDSEPLPELDSTPANDGSREHQDHESFPIEESEYPSREQYPL